MGLKSLQRLREAKIRDDINRLGTSVNDAYTGWQDQTSMSNTKRGLENASNTLKSYLSNGGDKSFQSLADEYSRALGDWDDLSSFYSSYQNKDAFDKARRTYGYDQKYSGKSYDDIKKAYASGGLGDEEKDYLRNYTKYSSLKDFDAALNDSSSDFDKTAIKNARSNYETMNAFNEYKDIMNRPDFESTTEYKEPTLLNKVTNRALDNVLKFGTLGTATSKADPLGITTKRTSDQIHLNEITDPEMQRVGQYILQHEPEKYNDYMKAVNLQASADASEKAAERWANWTNQNRFTGAVGTLVNTIGRPIASLGATIEAADQFDDYNPFRGASGVMRAINKSQQALSDSIEDEIGFLGKLGYNALTEGITSRIGQASTGGLYNLVMGGGVFAQTYGDALLAGMGKEQALGKAVAAGAIETATEAIGMESAFKKIPNKKWWYTMLKQGGAEGAEEVVGNIGNLVYDVLANGRDAEVRRDYQRYLDQGYTKGDAVRMASTKFALETMEEAATAALSAGATGGVSAVRTSSLGSNIDFARLGEAVSNLDPLSKVRINYDIIVNNFGENVPDWNKGFLYQQAGEAYAKSVNDMNDLGAKIERADEKGNEKAVDKLGDKYAEAFNQYRALNEYMANPYVQQTSSQAETTNVQPTTMPAEQPQAQIPEPKTGAYNVVADSSDQQYITRSSKDYNEATAKIYRNNWNGANTELYKAVFDVINSDAKEGIELTDEELSKIPESAMSKSQAASIYAELKQNNANINRKATERNNDIISRLNTSKYVANKFSTGNMVNGEFVKGEIKGRRSMADKGKVQYGRALAAMGLETHVYKDRNTAESGFVNIKDGAIYLNLAARYDHEKDSATLEEFISTGNHEIFHFVEAMLGDEVNDFVNDVQYAMGDNFADALAKQYMKMGLNPKNVSEEDRSIARKEVVADFVRRFDNADAFARFLSQFDESKLKKWVAKVKANLTKYFEKIREVMGMYDDPELKEETEAISKDIEAALKKSYDDLLVRALNVKQVQLQEKESNKEVDTSESEADNDIRYAKSKPASYYIVKVKEMYSNAPKEFRNAYFDFRDALDFVEFDEVRSALFKEAHEREKDGEPISFTKNLLVGNHSYFCRNKGLTDFTVSAIKNINDIPWTEREVKFNGRTKNDINRISSSIGDDGSVHPNDNGASDGRSGNEGNAQGAKSESARNRGRSDGSARQSEGILKDIRKSIQNNSAAILGDVLGNAERLQKDNETLQKDIARFKELLKLQGTETNGKVFKYNQLLNVARDLKKRGMANSTIDENTLAKDLNELYNDIVKQLSRDFEEGEVDNTENIVDMCKDVAREILNENKGEKVIFPEFKEAYNNIRDTRITLSEAEVEAMRNIYGNNWHQQTFGRFKLVKDGMSLKKAFESWKRQFPWAVDEVLDSKNPTAEEMVVALGDIYNLTRDSMEMTSYFVDESDVQRVAEEIYNKFWTVSTMETVADKYANKIKELRYEHRQAMDSLRQSKEDELKQLRADKNEIIKRVRERGEQRLKEYKEMRKAAETARRDNALKKAYVERITDTAKQMIDWYNNNQKDKKVLDVHKQALEEFLNSIDFSSKQALGLRKGYEATPTVKDRQMTDSLRKITEMAEKLKTDDVTIGLSQEEIERAKTINSLMEDMKGNYVLNMMDVDDLRDLSTFMQMLRKAITDSNDLFYGKQKKKIQDLVLPDDTNNKLLGQKNDNGVKAFFEFKNSTPIYAFDHLGSGALEVFHEAMDGWDEYAFLTQDIEDFLIGNGKNGKPKGILVDTDYKKWQSDIKKFTINGKEIEMPVSFIMNLYNMNKREQGKNHLYGLNEKERQEMEANGEQISDNDKGGISILSFDGQDHDQHWDVVTLTPEDVKEITSVLTEPQIAVADAMAEYYKKTAQWINETSRKYKGVGIAYEDNYWNLDTVYVKKGGKIIEEDNPSDMTGASLFSLLNKSFTKPINVNAHNPVKVGDIFDVFFEHTTDAAKYKALALPALDIYRYANYAGPDAEGKEFSMKASIEKAHGTEAYAYINKFLQVLNGTSEHGRDEKLAKILVKNYKAAQVAANIQTAALQPIAIIRADLKMDKGYLLRGAGMNNKQGQEEMLKYSGIALWKERGGYDINTQRGLYNKVFGHKTKLGKTGDKILDVRDNVVEMALTPAGYMDKITWAAIWNGCKAELMDKGLKGEELMKQTAYNFREVVYYTQVVDSTMTRSEKMRDPTMFGQLTTSFLSEPTLSMNMLMDAVTQYSQDYRKYYNQAISSGKSEAQAKSWATKMSFSQHGQYIGKCISIYLVSAAVESIIRGLFTKYRGNDDDEDTMLQTMWKEFIEQINPMQSLPVFRDVYNEFKGYKTQRTDMAAISNLATAYSNWKKILAGDKNVDYKTIYKTVQAVSQLTGIPVSSLMRDIKAGYDIVGEMYPSLQVNE